jgi:hypothetical protein
MANRSDTIPQARLEEKKRTVNPDAESQSSTGDDELSEARGMLEQARERFITAAVAFCDGSISAGQLRASREMLRDKEQVFEKIVGAFKPPFKEPDSAPFEASVADKPSTPPAEVDLPAASPPSEPIEPLAELQQDLSRELDPELTRMLSVIRQKMAVLEQDFQQGRVNASQYRAIRRHYQEQSEVAQRLRSKYPESDRWRVVLEEGKTAFLMQLNEAACISIGFYGIQDRERIYAQGKMPAAAEDAMGLLGTFGSAESNSLEGRMFATKSDDGTSLLLIPGEYTLCLAVFSQDPPAWQVRALREVHRNFEGANKASFLRGDRGTLIFPDLSRFIKP